MPSGLTEEEEAARDEAARQAAREKKRRAEKARKGRRKEGEARRKDALLALSAAAAGEDAAALEAALDEAMRLGGESDAAVAAAEARLRELRDPERLRRQERERAIEQRVADAKARLGTLSEAQLRFLRGEKVAMAKK